MRWFARYNTSGWKYSCDYCFLSVSGETSGWMNPTWRGGRSRNIYYWSLNGRIGG